MCIRDRTWNTLASGSAANFSFVVTYGIGGHDGYTNTLTLDIMVTVQ